MSPPVGPTGCRRAEAPGAEERPWFAGVTYGFFETRLVHSDGIDVREDQVSVAFGRRWGDFTFNANVGAVLGGTLETEGRTFQVERGWLASVSVARRWLLGEDRSWFVTGSFSFGASSAPTREEGAVQGEKITATDARIGVLGGVTLWDRLSPYLLVRGFGGPVFWTLDGEEIVTGDAYHYNLGGGLSLQLPGNIIALVDASALGERSLSVGVSALF